MLQVLIVLIFDLFWLPLWYWIIIYNFKGITNQYSYICAKCQENKNSTSLIRLLTLLCQYHAKYSAMDTSLLTIKIALPLSTITWSTTCSQCSFRSLGASTTTRWGTSCTDFMRMDILRSRSLLITGPWLLKHLKNNPPISKTAHPRRRATPRSLIRTCRTASTPACPLCPRSNEDTGKRSWRQNLESWRIMRNPSRMTRMLHVTSIS